MNEVKRKYEQSILEYAVLVEKHPLNKFYKTAEFVLSQEYPILFGDEEYGKFLANRNRLMIPIREEYEKELDA